MQCEDAHCLLGFAKVYFSKVRVTAVVVLDDPVAPFGALL
jgi:hypothetical protein